MSIEKAEDSYSWENVLSFDRLKRSVLNRVLERLDMMFQQGKPVNSEQINDAIGDEWQKVKQAVRISPAAREAAHRHMEHIVIEQVDKLIQQDREELESLGVVEKSL
ncbi:MAG: hypothetical protein U9Q31_00470 [Chloroflexota bacterium]|nr:hypothetical protein [Chloroflexota bacterium]